MKRIVIFAISALLAISCTSEKAREVAVIPQPQVLRMAGGGFFTFKRGCTAAVPDSEAARAALFLGERLENAAGIALEIREGEENGDIVFLNTGLSHEEYTIRITPSKIEVGYGDGAGAFYAVQTLLQLLPTEIFASSRQRGVRWSIPCCEIEDKPAFKYRGMHLDVCLHYFDMDFLKRYIDLMALHKVNVFHWHLTEDQGWRLEIKKYPLLTEKGQWRKETVVGSLYSGIYDGTPHGGFYTQEQARELVRYAAERHVTIVPEIEMPGHSLAAIACYPELSCGLEDHYETATRWGIFRPVYCPKDETFKFLEDVLDEVFDIFPSTLVHIGGDECPKKSWQQCPHCQALIRREGLKDEYELQSWFIRRMVNFIESRGREAIGWDEILQGGLAPGAKVMSWLGEEGGINAARMHHEVVMAPHPKYYLDYWQADPESEPLAMGQVTTLRTTYDYNPVPDVLTDEEKKYIIGVEGCLWTEYVAAREHAEYMAYPRMAAIAETGWSGAENKDWNSFAHRIEKMFGRYDALGVNCCRAFYDPYIVAHPDTEYSNVVTIEIDAPDAEVRYTLDGSEPSASSQLYTGPFVINRQQKVAAAAFRAGAPIGQTKYKTFNYIKDR